MARLHTLGLYHQKEDFRVVTKPKSKDEDQCKDKYKDKCKYTYKDKCKDKNVITFHKFEN